MVKTKQQKSTKPKRTPNVKKQGKQADMSSFRSQLDTLGLKIVQVTADGNCFFRCLAYQLEGNEEEHGKYRSMVVQYIVKNREMFEPFIEDEVPFDKYCQSMETDGTWAGHMELQAASLVTHCNICIHKYMSPRWYIQNFDQHEVRMIHLSYHDEEHYNSVRSKEDPCNGPATTIIIKADADIAATSHKAKAEAGTPRGYAANNIIDAQTIKLVMSGSGCENIEKVKQALLEVGGDVDAAIEFLIAEQGIAYYSAETDSFPSGADTSNESQGDEDDRKSESHEELIDNIDQKQDPSINGIKKPRNDGGSTADNKSIPRNKVCPCGSRKKYKSCCGAAKGGVSNKFAINQTVETRKGAKDKQRGKKVGPGDPCSDPENGQLDMGALCI